METNTEAVDSLAGLRDELVRLRRGIVDVATAESIGVAAAGTAPMSAFPDFELTTTGRYGRMQEQYRLLVDEQLICGLQIHVGVSDRDLAVQIMQRIAADLPILLALSASSPYWNEQDTGYASIRSIIWQRWPTAGATGRLRSAREYDELITDLINTGVIADEKMAYSRRAAIRARTDPRAAHLRRVPAGRRRDCDRRTFQSDGAGRGAEYRQRPPIRSGPAAGASGGDLAGSARGPDACCWTTLATPPHCPPVGRSSHCCGGSVRSFVSSVTGTWSRSWSRTPWPAATRRPSARGIRRRRPARRRRLARGGRDTRAAGWAAAGGGPATAVPRSGR